MKFSNGSNNSKTYQEFSERYKSLLKCSYKNKRKIGPEKINRYLKREKTVLGPKGWVNISNASDYKLKGKNFCIDNNSCSLFNESTIKKSFRIKCKKR